MTGVSLGRHARRALGPTVLPLLLACGGDDPSGPSNPPDPGGPGTPAPGPPVVLSVSRTTPPLDRWGDTATVTVTARDANGRAVSPGTVTFASSDTSVVRASAGGKLTSWRSGTARITATAGALTDTVTVTVRLQGNTACTVPTGFPTRGPVAPMGSWTAVEVLALGPADYGAFSMPMDVNLDGRMDVLASGHRPTDPASYSSAHALLNLPGGWVDGTDGAFLDGQSPFEGVRDYVYGDFDGDGLADVYVANPGFDPGGIDGLACDNVPCEGAPNALLLAQPGGGVRNAAATAIPANATNGFTHSVDGGDVDCDGDLDVFEGRWNSAAAPAASMLRINTAGVLSVATDRISGGPITPAAGSAFCDLDRDGDPELLVAPAPGPLRVFVNDGSGHFRALPDGTLPPSRSPSSENTFSDINCADLDLDGWLDLIVHDHSFNAHDGKWQVFRNLGDMRFQDWTDVLPEPEGVYQFPMGGGPSRVYDMNGDGWPDLLTGDFTVPLRILWNQGGSFTTQTLVGRWGDIRGAAPAVADFDGDGRLDIWLSLGGQMVESWVMYQR